MRHNLEASEPFASPLWHASTQLTVCLTSNLPKQTGKNEAKQKKGLVLCLLFSKIKPILFVNLEEKKNHPLQD